MPASSGAPASDLPLQVEALTPGGVPSAIDGVLAASPPPLGEPPNVTGNLVNPLQRRWLTRTARPDVGLLMSDYYASLAKWLGVDAGDVLPGAPSPISGMIRYQ